MPQLQDLVLTDRKTTPVNHTFTNGYLNNGVAVVEEYADVPIGSSRVSLSLRKTGGKAKGRMVLNIPVVQSNVVGGVANPEVVRTAIVDVSVTFDLKSTEQERNDAIGMAVSALATNKVLVHDTFVKLGYIS